MFIRVKMSGEEEINRSVYASVVLSQTELRRARRERMFMLQGDRGSGK